MIFNTFSILLLQVISGVFSIDINEKICTDNFNRDACNNIERDQNYSCGLVISKTDCFLNIDKGLPQFTIVYPEQALLAAPLVSEQVVVIGEVETEQPAYQTVVIVRKQNGVRLEDFRGKRFCHPGYEHDDLVTRYVLEEFQNKLLNSNINYCNTTDNVTLTEKRTRALASFLGPSCIPGSWTDDDKLDAKLKSDYSRLCELCGPQKCDLVYETPFADSIRCLTQNEGDIALSTLREGQLFFNNSNNNQVFQYFCPNGTVSESSRPCTWTNQLNRLVIAGKDAIQTGPKAPKVYLEEFMKTSLGAESLRSILPLTKSDKITYIEPTPLKTFVEARRKIPSLLDNIQCNLTVKWCTLNEQEQKKCLWTQQASLNSGLQPAIECVQSNDNDSISCLNDIASGVADLAFTDVTYGYLAIKKGLTVVAYPDTDLRQLSSVVIVVRKDTGDIKSLRDLKGKRACLPEYGGKEWLAFIDTLRTNKIVPDSCDYKQVIGDFVGSSCFPGANLHEYALEDGSVQKFCEQCLPADNYVDTAKYCNSDYKNKYFTSEGSLRCLKDQNGDYAVVTINDISPETDTSDFRVLCKNGSLSERTGLDVDEKAPLTIITAGGIVVKNDTMKNADIVLLLRGIDEDFGLSLRKIFKVFESFDGKRDLLFPDSTTGLSFTGSQGVYVENFKKLIQNSEKCSKDPNSSASYNVIPSTIILILGCFILRF
ncbi:transferrin isoform X2 [Leptinotarsa decemlineata]|uniref:transferrin isoform X2 n=1 Tax=Leptinotarsa decemlineata TaxID=7539 RepID=UPI003D30B9CF